MGSRRGSARVQLLPNFRLNILGLLNFSPHSVFISRAQSKHFPSDSTWLRAEEEIPISHLGTRTESDSILRKHVRWGIFRWNFKTRGKTGTQIKLGKKPIIFLAVMIGHSLRLNSKQITGTVYKCKDSLLVRKFKTSGHIRSSIRALNPTKRPEITSVWTLEDSFPICLTMNRELSFSLSAKLFSRD